MHQHWLLWRNFLQRSFGDRVVQTCPTPASKLALDVWLSVGHVRSHSEFGCEFLDKGRNPLTVDFKLRGSLDLMLVLGAGCSQQAFAFEVAGCPQKSSVQQCQSAPKFAIHVGPKT